VSRLDRNDWFVLILLVSMSALLTFSGLVIRQYWIYEVVTGAFLSAIVIYILVTRERLLANLLVFGLVAGFLELVTDWYHVEVLRTLVYDRMSCSIWASPGYMPFGWAILLFQYGYAAVRLSEFIGTAKTTVLLIAFGASMTPWYEELAWHAQHWHYQGSPAIGHTPYWVSLSYSLIMAAVGMLTPRFRNASAAGWAGLGVVIGIVIFCSGYVSHLLLG